MSLLDIMQEDIKVAFQIVSVTSQMVTASQRIYRSIDIDVVFGTVSLEVSSVSWLDMSKYLVEAQEIDNPTFPLSLNTGEVYAMGYEGGVPFAYTMLSDYEVYEVFDFGFTSENCVAFGLIGIGDNIWYDRTIIYRLKGGQFPDYIPVSNEQPNPIMIGGAEFAVGEEYPTIDFMLMTNELSKKTWRRTFRTRIIYLPFFRSAEAIPEISSDKYTLDLWGDLYYTTLNPGDPEFVSGWGYPELHPVWGNYLQYSSSNYTGGNVYRVFITFNEEGFSGAGRAVKKVYRRKPVTDDGIGSVHIPIFTALYFILDTMGLRIDKIES